MRPTDRAARGGKSRSTITIVGVTRLARAPLYVIDSPSALGQEQLELLVLGYTFSRIVGSSTRTESARTNEADTLGYRRNIKV